MAPKPYSKQLFTRFPVLHENTLTRVQNNALKQDGKSIMSTRIDSIYCFDYTKAIGHYDSIRDFASEEMTYIGLALSSPKVHVNSTPCLFDISCAGSNRIREYAVSQLANLQEISEELAVNSPKYILICYFDGSNRYFAYNEQFFNMFKIVFQYKPRETISQNSENPYVIQKNEPSFRSNQIQSQQPSQMTSSYSAQYSQQNGNQHSATSKKDSFPWWKLILGIGIFVVAIIVIFNAVTSDDNVDAGLTPVIEPASGTILSGSEVYNGSQITIHAAREECCVVKIKNRFGAECVSFYVRAGDTVTVGVPAEHLQVYFATGDTWYGTTDLFGSKTRYSMDDKIRDFSKEAWEYTRYPVNNGNFSETPINEDEFK